MIAVLIVTILSNTSFAGPPPKGKSLGQSNYDIVEQPLGIFDIQGRLEKRSLQVAEAKKEEPVKKSKRFEHIKITKSSAIKISPSNLPSYYQGIDRSDMKSSDRVVFVPQNSTVKLTSVRSGDLFKAVIEQEIKASPSVPTPIRAQVLTGGLKGGFFLGEATLDRELKRILLSFTKIKANNGKIYSIKASGLSPLGSIGLEGEYESQSGKFFVAELASATAAGFLDATISRNQTAFGNYTQEPSLSNSAKTGAVTALSKTADRFAEDARTAPEFTKIEGYQQIQIIVQDDPIETN